MKDYAWYDFCQITILLWIKHQLGHGFYVTVCQCLFYELWTILEDVLPKSRPTVFSSACAMTSPHESFLVLQKIVPTTTSDYLLKVTSSCCRSFMLHNVICISPSMFVNAYSSQEQQQALRFTVIILMTAF